MDSVQAKVMVARQAVGLLPEILASAEQDPQKLLVAVAVARRAILSLEAVSAELSRAAPADLLPEHNAPSSA